MMKKGYLITFTSGTQMKGWQWLCYSMFVTVDETTMDAFHKRLNK
jgi:hypothetical protein